MLVATTAHAAPLTLYESREHRATTEGDAVLPCEPDVAFLAATDYKAWPRIFPDLRQVHVKQRAGNEARVTFVHANGERADLHFKTQPSRHTLWFEQTNGDVEVWAEICFLPGERPGTTRVHATLHADVTGWKGAFASDGEVRARRREQVRNDLVQLQAFFTHR